jgi:hypothetical protein
MNKYKTANGTIATEQELRSYYGAKFDEMLASGAFVKIEDGTELKKKVSPILPMAPQQEQAPSAIPGVQPYTGSPLENTSSVSQSSQSNAIPVRPTDVPDTRQQMDQPPLGVFNQKIADPNYNALTPDEQAGTVKIKQPTPSAKYKTANGAIATEQELRGYYGAKFDEMLANGVFKKVEEDVREEADYFTGAFGDVLRGFDKISPVGIGDFVDDIARSVASGYRQGTAAQEADNLLLQGTKATPEQIQKFIDANKNAQSIGPSQEMQDYQKIYEEEGKGFWGVIKGLAKNPTVIPEVLSSSLIAMATNTDALKAGAAAIGTGASVGAGIGAFGGGVAAIPGALAGAEASIPYAFGLASSVVEMGSTFGELLTDELNGKEMTKENVKAILENPEKLQSIRNKAIARGAIIGTVDALTGKLASGVGAKIIGKSAAKSATGAVAKGAITRATAAGAAIEAAGGSAGEAAARGAIGQEMDVSEIALEGLAELPGGIRSTLQARLTKPSYKVNGAKATAEQVDELINTMTPNELQQTKIDIKNDYEGREFKIQDKIVTNSVKEQVRQGNPDLNEPSLNAITDLELQLRKLEGNTTQTGKDKAAAIRTQIKDIQENQIQEEAKVATIEAEAPEITTKRADKIAELETSIADENIPAETKPALKTELETLKKEQDAIQKQSTNEGVLRTGKPEVGLQEVGKGNVQPEVTTTGTEEVVAEQPKQEEVAYIKNIKPTQEGWFTGEFGEKGSLTWEIPESQRETETPKYLILQSIGSNQEKSKGEGSKAIADLFNKYPSVEEMTFDVEGSKEFYDKIGAIDGQLKREDFFNYYNSKFPVVQEASLKIEPIISESELPGYDRMIQEVDGIVKKSKDRGVANEKVKENVMDYVSKSSVYEKATDVQREKLVRDVNKMFGVKEKAAPSAAKIIGDIKDVTKITMTEKQGLVKQIKDLARGAKDAKMAFMKASNLLTKEINELESSGKITAKQVSSILRRFSSVNVLNEKSVEKFVGYMSNVFENAEYANKIDIALNLLTTAKKNIGTKIGISDGLVLPLQKLFSINPNLIPESVLDKYLSLVDMFGKRQAVLALDEKSEVTKTTQDILKAIEVEQSLVDELSDRFNASENRVFDEDGKLDYAASLKQMVKQEEITEDDADIMRKYKSDIIPQVEKAKITEEEIAEEKNQLINTLKQTEVNSKDLPTQDERKLAKQLKDLASTDAVEKLNNTDLKNLLKVFDNINNNYLPHYAELMVEKLNAINNAKTLTSAVKRAVVAPLSGLYSRIKAIVTRSGRTGISEMIRRNPLFYVDQLFGDFKTKDIFNSILNEVSEGESKFKTDLKRIQNILEKAEERVAKSFKLDANKTLMSKFKMMTYMVQLENDSNQGSKQVNPAADYLKATIKHIDEGKSQFGQRDSDMLQEILDKYTDSNGDIDNKKLYNSFNEAEKSAIKDIRGINESLKEKAEYTAAIIRGDRINPLSNYVHLNVLHEHKPNDLTSGVAFINDYNNSMRPSTKAKSLIERTGKVSPLNFDVFASAQRGAKFVLMDYNLTAPIRTARKTIKQTISNFEEQGRIPKEKRQIINAIDSAFEEATENVLTNSFVTNSLADDVVDYINKQGYRSVLAGTSRFVSELMSNIGFAVISDPKAFSTGVANKGFIMSTDAPLVMENVNSKQTNRIFPTDTLSGKLIDTNILQQTSGIKGAKSKNPVANKTQQIWNLSGKKYVNAVELTADALISTPDKLVMRPMWFGSFANEFKKITGEKVDFDKIASNDEKYMEQNKKAIEKAKTTADERAVMIGATDNPFMGILKGTVKPDQSVTTRAFNNFNNFMTRFLIFEYVTARTGIMAAMGNGSLSKKQGAAVLSAVTTRMVVYTLLTQMLGTGLMGLIIGGDDEKEDEKSFMQKFGQAFTSAFTSMIFGRDFGNATKTMVNYGIERVNENYLDFLREDDYDPYKDAIQYSIVPPEKKGEQRDLSDFLLNMGGSFGPALKTANFITRKALEPEKEDDEAYDRQQQEINVRIPLEILGTLGLVPLYKDIRKSVLKDMYSGIEEAEENAADKKRVEQEKLNGYKNQEDMKRYDPELWDKTYGPNSPDYDEKEAKKNLKREKDKLEREMKDEMYEYVPKKKSKGGFGSSKFGSK